MRTFKKIKILPLIDFESLGLNVASKKGWDLTSLPQEKQEEVVGKAMKIIHDQYKGKGVVIAGSRSDEPSFIMTQVRSAQNKRKIFSFPEPNPVCLYYKKANMHLEAAYKHKIAFNGIPATDQAAQGEVFAEFFTEISSGIVSSIMTLEGFINQLLSDTHSYQIDGKSLSKRDIEWLDFNTKIREVIPVISGIDYVGNYKEDYDNLSLTNSLRDDLIHLKRLESDSFTNYQTLFKRLLDFDPVNASNSVFNFVNTVKPEYFIEEG